MTADAILWYETNARSVAPMYESLAPEQVHEWLGGLIPPAGGIALDIGAGTGRDAAWLARQGLDVIAVEPSTAMREQAQTYHAGAPVRWIADAMPELRTVRGLGLAFDLILLSAVWMHVAPLDRARAFRKLIGLLKPGGVLAITLRMGAPDAQRGMHPVSEAEIERLARAHGAFVTRRATSGDLGGRSELSWIHLAIRLPDDGTGALPLLRHVILNDAKSSTYKLALLRAIARIADGAAGFARALDDDRIALPLGLVALYWIRLYKPLLAADLPQAPTHRGTSGLGFVGKAYLRLADLSPLDLRIGMRFTGDRAAALRQALRDAAGTIAKMPVHYLTYPDASPIFGVLRGAAIRHATELTLDDVTLRAYGELVVPAHVWDALRRFDAWVEPAIVAEWIRLMGAYATRQERALDDGRIAAAMRWSEPERDTALAREQAMRILGHGNLYCVWSGRRLTERALDMDHCFPWAAWPCDHLWNLMPTHPRVNRHEKRDRLPSDERLRQARERICDWWDRAYLRADPSIDLRFRLETRSGLPAVTATDPDVDDVFEGLTLQRLRLRADQGIPEWGPPTAIRAQDSRSG